MSYFIQQSGFVWRFRFYGKFCSFLRTQWFSFLGMKIGKGTSLPVCEVSWPHQVMLGNDCKLESGIQYKYDGIWQSGPSIRIQDNVFIGAGCEFNIRIGIDIGMDALIASGCKFIDHDHGIDTEALMRNQHGPEKAIMIGRDVWLGCNVIVLKGVEIGNGSVVAAGAVVTKSIPSMEIWAGIPAKKIGYRHK